MFWLFNWGNKSVAKPKNSNSTFVFLKNPTYIFYESLDLGLNILIRLILVQVGSLKDSKMQWINPAMKSSQNHLLLNPLVKNQVSIRKGDQKQSKVCTLGGVKSLVSRYIEGYSFWGIAETASRAESGQLQFWSQPSEILNLRSWYTSETVAFNIPRYQTFDTP